MSSATVQHMQQPMTWVKPELDKSVAAVRASLEQYGKSLDAHGPLLEIPQHLHLLRGTLHMLEFYGASLLIEDMEKTVRALVARQVEKPEDAYEALVHATLSLDGYLDKLSKTPVDIPLVLLPIINDLRASRGEPLLTESALFLPNLSIVPKIPDNASDGPEAQQAFVDSANSLRPYFHAALLSWFRNPKDALSLQQLKLVIRNLESSSGTPRVRQLWWVAGGLVEALADKGLKASVSARLLLGQLDRYIKLITRNEHLSLEKAPPVELLKNLLFYVAHARSSGERVSTLKKAYQLERITPTEDDIQSLRNNIRAPKSSTFKSIAIEINKTLQQVKSVIDSYVRGNNRDKARLQEILQPLRHVADTLSLMSLGKERQLMVRQLDQFARALQKDVIDRDELMNLAAVILHVESVVNNIGNERRMISRPEKFQQNRRKRQSGESMESGSDAGSLTRLPDTEYRLLIQQAAQEARKNIVEVKNNILAYLTSQSKQKLVARVPEQLNEVKGCLVVINKKHAADLVNALMDYTVAHVLSASTLPQQTEMDEFAEAIVGLEYYLEAVSEGRSELDSILTITRSSLEKLGYKIEPPKASDLKSIPTLESVVTHIHDAPKQKTSKKGRAENAAAQPVAEEKVVTVEEEARDEEVAEIFVEEAYEELAQMSEALRALKTSADNQNALANIRRVYHTLKGSGRIAGASDISEFAAVIEEYINRVLYGASILRQPGLGLLTDAYETLHLLVEAFKNRTPLPLQANKLIKHAIDLMTADEAEEVETTRTEPEVETQSALKAEEVPVEETVIAFEGSKTSATETADVAKPENKDDLLASVMALEDYIASSIHSNLNKPIPNAIVLLANNLKEFAEQADVEEFKQITELLHRYVNNIARRKTLVSVEALEIMQEYCTTTREIFSFNQHATEQVQSVEHIAYKTTAEPSVAEELEIETPAVEQQNEIAANTSVPAVEPVEEEDDTLIDIFIEEARELVAEAHENLSQWQNALPTITQLVALQRALHTLKGSARMAGISAVGNVTHAFESLIEEIVDDIKPTDESLKTLSENVFDAITDMVDDLESGSDIRTHSELFDTIGSYGTSPAVVEEHIAERVFEDTESVVVEQEQAEEAQPAEAVEIVAESETKSEEITKEETVPELVNGFTDIPSAADQASQPVAEVEYKADVSEQEASVSAAVEPEGKSEPIRIESRLLDMLVDHANEESAIQTRLNDNVEKSKSHLLELDKAVTRLRDQMRDLEFSNQTPKPATGSELDLSEFSATQELAQRLMETIGDIENLHGILTRITLESDSLLHQQGKVHGELHEGLLGARMISFSNQSQRLQRIVRQTTKELGKHARLILDGTEGSLDRALLDKLMGPLEHIIRNAIAHGIEDPQTRKAKGKDETGLIRISFEKHKSENILRVGDDGAGINLDAVRRKAAKQGLTDDASQLTDEQAINLIFEPGFSTSDSVSQIAGRGVGMDVVDTEIQKLGGTINVQTQADVGTVFTIRLPFTMALSKTMLVRIGEDVYALPTSAVETVLPVAREDLAPLYMQEKPFYEANGKRYPLYYLDSLLNATAACLPPKGKTANIILLRGNRMQLALHVDEVIETKDTVMKPTGPQLNNVRGIAGATILGDGQVILIIDAPALLKMATLEKPSTQPLVITRTSAPVQQNPVVLVVDDSITVRKVTERFLKRNGFDVLLAKDGVEALETLEENKPDLMLLDIEMPRMDGLEVTRKVRAHKEWRDIPIIMITSRTGKTHRDAANEAGVNIFMGKPYQENILLDNINKLAREKKA